MEPIAPVRKGHAVRDGVRVAWRLYGAGEPTIFLLPCWSIIHARHWKMQVPFLARHARVLTMDGRGNGASDRPADAEAYADIEFAADALAVMDAAEVDRAAVVSLSAGARWALLLASDHADRVSSLVFIDPSTELTVGTMDRVEAALHFFDELPSYEGWTKVNANYWRTDYRGWLEFFFSRCFPEPHSSKPIEDCVNWGLETDAETLTATVTTYAMDDEESRALAQTLAQPALVIHGGLDEISPIARGQAFAGACGAPLLTFEGSGHCPHVREPVAVNLALRDFLLPRVHRRRRTRSLARARRALLVCSPIGLGHARRDLAIARELRRLVPDLEIDWLAQHPVTALLETTDERVHPASGLLLSESAHIERESDEHRLHVFEAWRRMDEILLANFMTFIEVVENEDYDLWIGDEAWEVDHYLFENPSLKRAPFAWLTDFVGWLPVPSGGERDVLLTADYNAEMIEHVARYPSLRDRAIFIGRPEDIVDERFGPGLARIRDWTEENFEFSGGYVLELDPGAADRAVLRAQLGYGPDEVVAIAAIGGSGIGRDLLARLIEAYPLARAQIPGLRLIAVGGPRLDPASLPVVSGVDIRSFVPDLNLHLAACDIGLVQGGLTTTMELAAYGRPFLYFPLRDHCEQQFHVHERLRRYGAGRRVDFDGATPESIASAMSEELASRRRASPLETGTAARVAERIADLLR